MTCVLGSKAGREAVRVGPATPLCAVPMLRLCMDKILIFKLRATVTYLEVNQGLAVQPMLRSFTYRHPEGIYVSGWTTGPF